MVCTYNEARAIIAGQDGFYISNCGCRERKGHCLRSRMDVCLTFAREVTVSGSNRKETDRDGADALVAVAAAARLIARPFRKDKNSEEIGGICFCCDDCCGVFPGGKERCDRGKMVETTVAAACIHCGSCIPYCCFQRPKSR